MSEQKTMWRVFADGTFERRRVANVTSKTIVYLTALASRERREHRNTDYHAWFDTFGEAKQWLVDMQTYKLEQAIFRADAIRDRLEKFKEVQEPKDLPCDQTFYS